MPYKRSDDELQVVKLPACVHLRSKAMYVTGQVDPTHEAGSHSPCWCNRTQHTTGPDDGGVDRAACVSGRACYQAR